MTSLKKNVLLNYINTLTSLIFPLITFPYAARVLMPDGMGTYSFINSIVSYIILFTSLGIPLYGIRVISQCRADEKLRTISTVELLLLTTVLAIVGYIAVFILLIFVPTINEHSSLFLILSLGIFFTAIGADWFYKAIEDFQYITTRSILFRSLSALALFIFVREQTDLLIYGFIMVSATVGSNVINFIHLRKFLKLDYVRGCKFNLKRHLKPAIKIFILNLTISLYVNLNTIMLGFMSGEEAVGFFSAGNRLSTIVLTVVASISSVMLPRSSNLIANSRIDEFYELSKKTINFILMISLPFSVGLMLLSKQIMLLFCGEAYSIAYSTLVLTAPIVIFAGISNVIGIQILYPQKKENIVILSTLCGALFNIIMNMLIIPLFSYDGASITTCLTELLVLSIQVLFSSKFLPKHLFNKYQLKYVLGVICMSIIIQIILNSTINMYTQIIASIIIGGMTYFIVLILLKEKQLLEIKKILIKK